MTAPEFGDLGDFREDYQQDELHESDLAPTWVEQFGAWLAEAVVSPAIEPNAMIVATADDHGRPSARTVLLKQYDARGLVFYTNMRSRKGAELLTNPCAALVFPWLWLQRQIVVTGAVEAVEQKEADRYFGTRPLGSRLSAIVSPQSQVIEDRTVLANARRELETDYRASGDLARPDHWGGLRVVPQTVEFWQGRPDRLHDRLRYRKEEGGAWVIERLAP